MFTLYINNFLKKSQYIKKELKFNFLVDIFLILLLSNISFSYEKNISARYGILFIILFFFYNLTKNFEEFIELKKLLKYFFRDIVFISSKNNNQKIRIEEVNPKIKKVMSDFTLNRNKDIFSNETGKIDFDIVNTFKVYNFKNLFLNSNAYKFKKTNNIFFNTIYNDEINNISNPNLKRKVEKKRKHIQKIQEIKGSF